MSYITELTKESIEKHNLEMINNLPENLIINILDYAKTVSSVYESVGDGGNLNSFLIRERWEDVRTLDGNANYSIQVRMQIDTEDSWYILNFENDQLRDPKVWIEDAEGNRQFQRGKTLICCCDEASNVFVLLVDLDYDLEEYETPEYEGYTFASYFNATYGYIYSPA